MPSLSTLNDNIVDIATLIAEVYIRELNEKHEVLNLLTISDIEIHREIDINKGLVYYKLCGDLGEKINTPEIKIEIPSDLLRGLKRGEKEYNKHVKNIPDELRLTLLVKEAYTTMILLKVGQSYTPDKIVGEDYRLNTVAKRMIDSIKKKDIYKKIN